MPRKNYTAAERALHIIGALAGRSVNEINMFIAVGDAGKRVPEDRRKDLPDASLTMLKRQYASALVGADLDWKELWDHCISPKKVGDL